MRADLFSGVFVLDGNRARFAAPDWKAMLAVKVLRARLREMLTRSFRSPGKLPTAQHERWLEVWQRVFALAQEGREKSAAAAAAANALTAATSAAGVGVILNKSGSSPGER